jgi:peptidoglycan/xylan/chitin deacetylase (PgdA/CDA1 family)
MRQLPSCTPNWPSRKCPDSVTRRSRILGLVLAAVATVAIGRVLWSPPDWLLNALPALFPGCLYRVQTAAPLVALTIDDGPDPTTTPLLLAELDRHQAHATFFVISSHIVGHEDLVRDMVRVGHEIGNHLTHDVPSIGLSPAAFEAALLAAHRTLAPFGPVTWARPSSGWYSDAIIAIMRRHGYRCALGSVYPFDATLASVGFASGFILRNAGPGAVIILHDGGSRGQRTAQVLQTVLPELRRRGLQVVSLSELVGAGLPGRSLRQRTP